MKSDEYYFVWKSLFTDIRVPIVRKKHLYFLNVDNCCFLTLSFKITKCYKINKENILLTPFSQSSTNKTSFVKIAQTLQN